MKKKPAKNKKNIIIAAILVLCLAAGGLYAWHRHTAGRAMQPASSKHFSPPTAQEKADVQAHKDQLVQQMNQEKQDQNTPGPAKVTPVITNANQNGAEVTIMGYVSGVVEDGGTCTATITQGALKITHTTHGSVNASTTQCAPITVDRSEFQQPGQWQVTLSYNSSAAEGTSQSQTLAIQ